MCGYLRVSSFSRTLRRLPNSALDNQIEKLRFHRAHSHLLFFRYRDVSISLAWILTDRKRDEDAKAREGKSPFTPAQEPRSPPPIVQSAAYQKSKARRHILKTWSAEWFAGRNNDPIHDARAYEYALPRLPAGRNHTFALSTAFQLARSTPDESLSSTRVPVSNGPQMW
ncbi:hypothetical protein H4582DRAFT_1251855 [Lactarius indigo]|nr:hypothetical protein H4582DRAFT_1251855 [Lactarius indigo]